MVREARLVLMVHVVIGHGDANLDYPSPQESEGNTTISETQQWHVVSRHI